MLIVTYYICLSFLTVIYIIRQGKKKSITDSFESQKVGKNLVKIIKNKKRETRRMKRFRKKERIYKLKI